MEEFPEWFVERVKGVKNKRASLVLEHIMENGFVTTEEIRDLGYDHPPRAGRDVREEGIPLETYFVKNSQGRRIGAYRFGDLSEVRNDRLGGRRVFSKRFKNRLLEENDSKCGVCGQQFEGRYLQIDHRVPYEVAGEVAGEEDTSKCMLLCGSCNRAKSWSCEHCGNWLQDKDPKICEKCYWASPEDYEHIALRDARRLDILWAGDEVVTYDRLKALAAAQQEPLPDYVKRVLLRHVAKKE